MAITHIVFSHWVIALFSSITFFSLAFHCWLARPLTGIAADMMPDAIALADYAD